MEETELPEGWKLMRLGSVCSVNWGNTSITKDSYTDTGFRAYSATGADGFLSSHEHEGEGIVLSAIGARCGKCFWADGKWTAIKNTIVIKAVDAKLAALESRGAALAVLFTSLLHHLLTARLRLPEFAKALRGP